MTKTPLRAERVFDLADTDEGWMLEATATRYRYPGPICYNPVPPWSADELEDLSALVESDEPRESGIHTVTIQESGIHTVTIRESGIHTVTIQFLGLAQSLHPNHPRRFATPTHALEAVERYGGERVGRFLRHPHPTHEGFHAFRPGTVEEHPGYLGKPVLAEVEIFGRVVEYERGYRAEKMRIEKLTVHPQFGEAVSDLEDRYHCDVEVREWQTSDERSGFMRSSQFAALHAQMLQSAQRPFLTASGTWGPPVNEKRSWFRRTWDSASEWEGWGSLAWYTLGYFVSMWTVAWVIGKALP